MKSINLIPITRLEAKRRRVHLRRCVAGCAAYALLLAVAGGAAHTMLAKGDPTLPQELQKSRTEMERYERDIALVRAELASVQSVLNASRSIVEQPDWSIVMALLGEKTGEDVLLKRCRLRPAEVQAATPPATANPGAPGVTPAAAAARPPADAPTHYLSIVGLGRSQVAVTQFVLRLEQTGLFGRVMMIDSNRESFLDGEAVAFNLECTLSEAVAATAPGENRTASSATASLAEPGVKP